MARIDRIALLLNRDWIFGLALIVVTLAAYQPAWNGKPIWDDEGHITVPELRSFHGLARIWTQPGATQQYYPVVHSVFWVEYRLWGDETPGYHIVNIFLHLLSALLLVRILRLLEVPGAWFIAALFALHPVQVESVAWITELKNTLSGVFFLATALAYLKFDRGKKRKYYAIALAFFTLGLLSKSVIATLPVSLLAVFWWKRGKIHWKQDTAPLLPFVLLGIVSGLFTIWMERKFIGAEGDEFTFTMVERCLIAGRVFWFYLGKIIFPVNLMFIYPRWNVSQGIGWQYLFPVAALVLAVVLWAARKHSRAPFAAFICYAATLCPVVGFFDVYPFRFSFVADHFQYLAGIGPLAMAAVGMRSAIGLLTEKRRRILQPVLYAVLLLVLGALTWKQSGIYIDKETLYRATINKNPDCWMAHNNLGLILMNTGRIGEAIAHYRRAFEIDHSNFEAHNNCGIALARIGRTDEAIVQYRKALEINPNFIIAHYNLGFQLAKIGRTDEAIAHINVLNGFAMASLNIGYLSDAIQVLQRSLEIAKLTGQDTLIAKITADLNNLYQKQAIQY